MQYISGIRQRKILLLALGLILAGCAILVWSLARGTAAEPAPADNFADTTIEEPVVDDPLPVPAPTVSPPLIVYISGAVHAPDVYRLPAGARVKDVVMAAGGLTDDADPAAINLADLLADAQHVHIPQHGAAPAQAQPDAGAAPGEPDSSGGEADLLDLNRANADDFEALPGVGQALATRIVEYREANGPFSGVDDLKQVKGIGPALFAKIAPLVRVGA
jgi:competence protein ComEA